MTIWKVISSVRANAYIKQSERVQSLEKYIRVKDDKQPTFTQKINDDEKTIIFRLNSKDKSFKSSLISFLKMIERILNHEPLKKKVTLEIGQNRFVELPAAGEFAFKDENAFFYDADQALLSDFNLLITNRLRIDEEYSDVEIEFKRNRMTVRVKDTSLYPACEISYDAKKDQISIEPYYESLYSDQLASLFETEVPMDRLPDYHRSLVEQGTSDKPVMIQGMTDRIHEHIFNIKENDDSVLLERVKK